MWFGGDADEAFWSEYWHSSLSTDYYTGARSADLATLIPGVTERLDPEGRHLEAGCGLGYYVEALAGRGFRIEGIEYSKDLVDAILRVRPTLPIRCEDALEIRVPDASYDSYLSFGVVEHRIEGPEPFLSEAFRVLKAGGWAFVSVPAFGPIRRLKAHLGVYHAVNERSDFFQYGFTAEEMRQLLRDAGFHPLCHYFHGAHRLLQEEVPGYARIAAGRGGRHVKTGATSLVEGFDGHMLMMIARKPHSP